MKRKAVGWGALIGLRKKGNEQTTAAIGRFFVTFGGFRGYSFAALSV